MSVKIIEFTEYEEKSKYDEDINSFLKNESINFEGQPKGGDYRNPSKPKYLAIENFQDKLKAFYYIGACWLKQNEFAAIVTPHLKNIDFVKMFCVALGNRTARSEFEKFYSIYLNEPEIEVEGFDTILTPLLIIHFLSLVESITKSGLKKEYIYKSENLDLKIKGHISFTKHIRKNISCKREDRIYCNYSDYTVDTLENRLLKKTLLFIKKALVFYPRLSEKLKTKVDIQLALFNDVSDTVEIFEIKNMKYNKMYRNYSSAIKLAKMILKHFGYSVNNIGNKHSVPPFWIDMPRLYEVFVLSRLERKYKNLIEYQVAGYYQYVDYVKIDEKLIIDAKYKPRYQNSNARIIEDIREISAYSRDNKIKNFIQEKSGHRIQPNEQLKCVIIFPKNNLEKDNECIDDLILDFEETKDNFDNLPCLTESAIKHFDGFYKVAIDLPTIK